MMKIISSGVIMLSTLLGVSSSNWVLVWGALELNTLLMCYLMMVEKSENSALQYFVPQTLASALLLCSVSMMDYSSMWSVLTILSLTLKMGVWPSHLWYMSVLMGLELKSWSFLMVATWQKILPACVLSSVLKLNEGGGLILLVLTLSLISPVMLMKPNPSIKTTLVLASIMNSGWIIIASMSSTSVLFLFLFLYCLALLLTILYGSEYLSPKEAGLLSVVNLAALPPTPLFWGKACLLLSLVDQGVPMFMVMLMILSSVLFCFYYLKSSGYSSLSGIYNTSSKKNILLWVALSSAVIMATAVTV